MFRRKSVCVVTLALITTGCVEDAAKPSDPKVALSIHNLDPGTPCAEGGKEILFGADVDNNGVLDEVEVEGSTLLCNGADGATGPKGDKGAAGANGATGSTGATGATGAAGADGVDGSVGPQGEPGLNGATGPKGDSGAAGSAGETGPQGAQGLKGDAGAAGAQGPQGEQGVQGERGPNGDAGAPGAQGPQGIQGERGDAGAQGVQGVPGAAGSAGVQGPQGIQGERGDAGAQGPQGAPGTNGHNSLSLLTPILAGLTCTYGGTLIQVGSDNGQGDGDPDDGTLHGDEVDNSSTICAGPPGPTIDGDLGTGNMLTPSTYAGDDFNLTCNNQGTTLDRAYLWTASWTGCAQLGGSTNSPSASPFVAVLDAVTGQGLACGQGITNFAVVSGTTYLVVAEPYGLGDNLAWLNISSSPFCS